MNREIKYALFDGRYVSIPDKSILYELCDSLKEAKRNAKDYGDDTVIVKAVVKGINITFHETIPQ